MVGLISCSLSRLFFASNRRADDVAFTFSVTLTNSFKRTQGCGASVLEAFSRTLSHIEICPHKYFNCPKQEIHEI
jgi:hypothetical protein